MRAQEFALLGRLLAAVPVRRVWPHEESAEIDRLCEVIREGYRALKNQPLPSTPPGLGPSDPESSSNNIGTFPHRN
jgi:hypothetical protein